MTTAGPDKRPRHTRILQECGPAAGRISGINHLVLFTHDMNEGVKFYRDLLGLRVVRTMRFTPTPDGLRKAAHHSSGHATQQAAPAAGAASMKVRQVFFEMGNGELFSLYETSKVAKRPEAPISSILWPAGDADKVREPVEHQKLDHLSFDVPAHSDVVWFREHLMSHGVTVSDVSERRGADNAHRFISSIYFYDPSGNPLEISSMNAGDQDWLTYDFTTWFFDQEPVPALLDGSAEVKAPLVPHWMPSAKR